MYVEDDILRFAGRGISNKYRESQVNREIDIWSRERDIKTVERQRREYEWSFELIS